MVAWQPQILRKAPAVLAMCKQGSSNDARFIFSAFFFPAAGSAVSDNATGGKGAALVAVGIQLNAVRIKLETTVAF